MRAYVLVILLFASSSAAQGLDECEKAPSCRYLKALSTYVQDILPALQDSLEVSNMPVYDRRSAEPLISSLRDTLEIERSAFEAYAAIPVAPRWAVLDKHAKSFHKSFAASTRSLLRWPDDPRPIHIRQSQKHTRNTARILRTILAFIKKNASAIQRDMAPLKTESPQ